MKNKNEERALPDFIDQAPTDRYCDLVLTGGVTSALVYPGVILGLGQAYRFHAIGGTSAGAGTAAMAAAAEFRRRRGSSDGFRTLLYRTRALKDSVDGRTGLETLFQPEPSSRRLFEVAMEAISSQDKLRAAVCVLLKQYWGGYGPWALLCIALLGLTIHSGPSSGGHSVPLWVAKVLLATGLLMCVVAPVFEIVRDLGRCADADFGLCNAQSRDPEAPLPPLVPWLHALLQDIAGLPHDRPLTFKDLHQAPSGPAQTLGDRHSSSDRAIDLRMYTTNIARGRPLLLPQPEQDTPLYFLPTEMRRLFPDAVVDHMKRAGGRVGREATFEIARERPGQPLPDVPSDERVFHCLPRDELPVLVAARLSLGFPVLISGVPLWERTPDQRGFRRLLFVDGGLCSNFPIHLFDSLIPAWPTFGVTLHDRRGGMSLDPAAIRQRVRVKRSHAEMPEDQWQDPKQGASVWSRWGNYAWALLGTTKDWKDTVQAELPGVRERVAEVALPDGVGGLYLRMDASGITWLGLAGAEVARQFLEHFGAATQGCTYAQGWREHRWVRLNLLADMLKGAVSGLTSAAASARYTLPLRDQIDDATQAPPLKPPSKDWPPFLNPEPERRLATDQAAALERVLDALASLERQISPPSSEQPYTPNPRPELRVRPPM